MKVQEIVEKLNLLPHPEGGFYKEMYRSAAILDDLLERCDATTIPVSSHTSYDVMYDLGQHFGVNMIPIQF